MGKERAVGSLSSVIDNKPPLSKKEKRRLDNRRSAELSRKRKRDRLELLERQVKFLKAQNLSLSARLGKYEHVEPTHLCEDLSAYQAQSPSTPVYRSFALPAKYLEKRNQQHAEVQKEKVQQKQLQQKQLQQKQKELTLFEQYSAQLTLWPILQILFVVAAVTIGLQTTVLAGVLFAVAAYWCTVTDMLPAHAKTAVAVASISVVTIALLQPHSQQLQSYCISPNL